jgi:alkylation response protein AidB-like acyl-CoA dehydrogenase
VVHVALTTEQSELVAAVARLVSDCSGDSPALSRGLTSMGLVGLRAPESLGGASAGAIEVALVVEQLARGMAGRGYLGAVLAVELLVAGVARRPGSPAATLAAEICAGRPAGIALDPELVGLAAVTREGSVGVDATRDAVVIGLDPAGGINVGQAGEQLDGADLTRALHRIMPADRDTTPRGDAGAVGVPAAVRWQALALALVCADAVGAMSGALAGAVAHAQVREQFGRPVGSFQAVQHLCADQLVSIEAARSVTWHAAWAVDSLDPAEALHAARVAKAWCAEVGREVCEAAVQVWGGLGMTWECDAHRYLRRVLLDRALFGDERVHLAAIADRQIALAGREALG